MNKKGGEIVKNCLGNALRSGIREGYSEERMFVKTITVGKSYSHKKIDIKGRGRHGMIHVPRCNIRIVMEERSLVDFFKMMLKGDSTPGLGMFFRKMLYQNSADFEHVKSLNHLTTSAGRRYRRVQFKRLVTLIQKEY